MINILSRDKMERLLVEPVLGEPLDVNNRYLLLHAFDWRSTIEGHEHWSRIFSGVRPFTQEDFFSLIDQMNGKEPPPRPPEEGLWI